jgi:hypothetical protein
MNPYQFIERVTGTIIGGDHKCARLYYDGRQQGGQLSGNTDADLIAGGRTLRNSLRLEWGPAWFDSHFSDPSKWEVRIMD